MSWFGDEFGVIMQRAITDIVQTGRANEEVEYIASETLGEVLEKLVILHVRIWMLDDAAGEAKGTCEAAAIHEKVDICDKVIRPRLMRALNQMLEEVLLRGRTDLMHASNVKHYEGYIESTTDS